MQKKTYAEQMAQHRSSLRGGYVELRQQTVYRPTGAFDLMGPT